MSAADAAGAASPSHASSPSHTSVYTQEMKKDKYSVLPDILEAKIADSQSRTLVSELFVACRKVSAALRTSLVTVEGTTNKFGDVVLTVDLIADQILFDFAQECGLVHSAASEEVPELKPMHEDEGRFILCWDPLDGSSIVDNNWSVGTIIGVWDRSTGLIGARGRDQVLAMAVQYGPRTTAVITLDDGVYEFTLQDGDTWLCSREQIQIAHASKLFAPANLRAAQDLPGYKQLVDYWMTNRYTLRYVGGLVPDVFQQFTKQQGIFANPTSPAAAAKLRICFEAAPFGLLVERCGGASSDGVTGGSILDVEITKIDQRTPLCLGSLDEVRRFNQMVLGLGAFGEA